MTVKDSEWNPEAFSTTGALEGTFASIPVGATKSFSYAVTPKFSFELYEHPAAEVSYVAEANGKPVATRSSGLAFRTYTAGDLIKFKALQVGSTLTLGIARTEQDWIRFSIVTGGGLLVYVLLTAYRGVSAARVKSRRVKALRELGMKNE